ncbi:PadR family transcriptional regulator [Actinocatenispora thailandica]|nr:PadR family transcriptional regulator [Actinocatenispora thailandica]
MSAVHVLLGILADGTPRHGYDLKQAYDALLPRARPLAFGQAYATLGRMVRDELVEEAGHDSAGGPERTSYTITDTGHVTLRTWLGTVERPAPFVTDALFTKVVVALRTGSDGATARAYLTAQRAAHAERMRELTRAKTEPGANMSDVVSADYLLGHLDADLAWMQTTLTRLGALRAELHEGDHR